MAGAAPVSVGRVAIRLKGPVPRKAPYVKFRYRLYVPADVRDWRARIARLFLRAGGRLARKGERVVVSYHYGFVASHADHDSITHSAQDALSKDALHCSDKEWFIEGITSVRVPTKRDEFIEIVVTYRQEDNGEQTNEGIHQRPDKQRRVRPIVPKPKPGNPNVEGPSKA